MFQYHMKGQVRIALTFLTLALSLFFVTPAMAANSADPSSPVGIVPVYVDGNPDLCLGGIRLDPPTSGTFALDAYGNTVTIVITETADGQVFSWSVSDGIVVDTVVAKGGSNANIYDYTNVDPSPSADGNLHSPVNSSGKYANLSHIDICFHYQLTASKTAATSYIRTYTWDISKSADPSSHVGFAGDTFTSDYAVNVDRTVTDSDFVVAGAITVNNPTPFTVDFSVSDSVDGVAATVICPTSSLAPGKSTTCTYTADMGDVDPGDGTNVATVTSTTANVEGTTASADYAFGDPTEIFGSPTISVTDSVQGPLGSASDDKTFEYTDDFACPTDPAAYTDGSWSQTYPNTATIDGTDQSASADVSVTCYIPLVSKTADARFNRDWDWTISKSADQTKLTLAGGQSFVVNYSVQVDATFEDSGFEVYGQITVRNPNPSGAMTVSLADAVGGTAATITSCTGGTYNAGSLTIPAGGTAVCDYTVSLGSKTDGTNTATITLNGIAFNASDDYAFAGSASETDECVDVSDDYATPADPSDDLALGTFCATTTDASETFTYSRTFGPYECSDVEMTHVFTNIASFVTNDNRETGSDDHTVTIIVPTCATGCTLTQGYWKTHSIYGPAPYDDAWLALGDADGDGVVEGADETFFNSGMSWYQVFWTPPAGNAYYNLAHQYMAAVLNIKNGAATTASVDAAIAGAEAIFKAQSSGDTSLTKAERSAALGYASTLDDYNNGLTGPGHCSEQAASTKASGGEASGGTVYLPLVASMK